MSAREDVSRAGLLAAEVLGAAPAAEKLAALRGEPLLLRVAPEVARTQRGQLMLATSASLLGRLFDFVGEVDVHVEGEVRTLPRIPGLRRGSRLDEATVALLGALRPPGRAGALRARSAARRGAYPRALAIGPVADAPAREAVCIDGEGWGAWAGPGPRVYRPRRLHCFRHLMGRRYFNPLGPLVAAAWGVAELGKHLLRALAPADTAQRLTPLEQTLRWDLWSHVLDRPSRGPVLRAPLRLDDVAVAGLGALGSAAVFALAQLPAWNARVELVDDDRLEVSNLERVLTARASDVGRRKIDLARRTLGGTWAHTVRIPGRYTAELPPRARAGTLLVGVDSGAARRRIARHLPYAVYNGGTQAGELLVSRHVAFDGVCPACLYPQAAGDAEARACGEALPDALPAATIGFVSALCGFLMVAELVKDALEPEREQPLDRLRPVFRLDVLGASPGPECVEAYVPRRDCFCQTEPVRREIAARRRG